MSDSIQVGDRVRWRSTRPDRNGKKYRVGTVLKVYETFAFVKPDKGQGHYQYLTLGRLTKAAVQP